MTSIWTVSAQADTAAPIAVKVVAPQVTQIREQVDLTGSVTAERDSALSPRVSGLVESVAVDAGARVERGAVLLTLDGSLARLALRRAEAAVAESRAQRDESRRLRDEAKRLAAEGNIPQSVYLTREAAVVVADAALARLDAERAEQAEMLARHKVLAPYDGVIVRRYSDPGEWVQTGTPVLDLVATHPLRVDVQLPQRYLGRLDANTRVTLSLDALPGQSRPAKLAATVPAADPATRTYLARLELDNRDGKLAPGMSARLRFELGQDQAVLLVPRDAVRRYPDGTHSVWIVEGTGAQVTAREQRVEVGSAREGGLTVLEGLAADARVVVRGNEALRNGAAVRIQP